MSDSIKNIDTIISKASNTCRIFYFVSERRDIIPLTIDGSEALFAKLERRCKTLGVRSGASRFQSLKESGKCINLADVYESRTIKGSIRLPQGSEPVILYLADFQLFDPHIRNIMVKTFLDSDQLQNCLLLLSSTGIYIPDGLGNYIELIQDQYITKGDIQLLLTEQVRREETRRNNRYFTDQELGELAETFVGLSDLQVREVLEQLSGVLCTGLKQGRHLELIAREKEKEIAKDAAVKFLEVPQEESVTGLGNYSHWLDERKEDFSNPVQAARQGTPPPKGVLLCGIPGTGKTAAARETARVLNAPLIQFDISRIQTSSFGGSEDRLRRYLERISAFGKCVMLIDEIEKVFAVNDSTHEVKRAMLSLLLDWMQTRKANVFTFITANDISALPPELLRDGRISGRFFSFMPSRDDLCSILQLKLKGLLGSGLLSNEFQPLLTAPLCKENAFAKMFDGLAEQAKKDGRNLFMTGANLEALVEMTNRKMRTCSSGGYRVEMYLDTMKSCALSQSFVPQGQSNMTSIVKMWMDAQKRQYQDVSANSILPFHVFTEDGTFKQIEKGNAYDDYLRTVLKERIGKIMQEANAQKKLLNSYGKKVP